MHSVRRARRAAHIMCAALVAACSSDVIAPAAVVSLDEAVASLTVNTAEFAIAKSAPDEERAFAVANDGAKALVAYTRNNVVMAKLVETDGDVAATVNTGRQGTALRVAYGASAYLLVWYDYATDRVWAQKISSAGSKDGAPFRISPNDQDYWPLGVAYGGSKFLLSFVGVTDGKVRVRFAYPDLLLEPPATIGSTEQYLPLGQGVASDGTNFVALFYKPNSLGFGLVARWISSAGDFGSAVTVNSKIHPGEFTGLAYSNGVYLVAFEKTHGASGVDIMGRILTLAGSTAGPTFPITAEPGDQRLTSVLKYGTSFLTMWEHFRDDGNNSARGSVVASDATVAPHQTYFSRTGTAPAKIPLAFGTAIGSQVFFAIGRGQLGQLSDWPTLSFSDVKGAVITP